VYITKITRYFSHLGTPHIALYPRAAHEQAHVNGCGPLSYEVWTHRPSRMSSLLRTNSKLQNRVLNKECLCSIETPLSCLCICSLAVCKIQLNIKVKFSRYKPGVAQRVGKDIALLFHDRGTRRGWVVSSTPRPHFTPGKDPVPIVQEAGWAPGPVWADGISRPHRDSIPDRPARSQSLYRLSYRALIYYVWSNSICLTPCNTN